MDPQPRRRLVRYLPQVAVATLAVVGGPVLAISTLRASAAVTSTVLLVAVGVLASIAISYAGAAYWRTRPGSGEILFADLMIWGWVRRWRLERRLSSAVELLGLRGRSGDGEAAALEPARRVQLLEDLAAALEARDPYTHGHSRRVARHASMIAKRMGLGRDQVARIRTAAAVHDVGKIETPEAILKKPARLTDEEFAVVKRHPVDGARMVDGLGDERLVRMVRHHHERLDGMGYPDGLAADRIPLGARIIAVADTFDAITSKRPYRPAKPHKGALELLSAEAGTQLDPAAVRAFLSYYSGHRLVAVWALLANGTQRLISSLTAGFGGATTAAKLSVATIAAALAGSAVFAVEEPQGSRSSGPIARDPRLVAVDPPRLDRSAANSDGSGRAQGDKSPAQPPRPGGGEGASGSEGPAPPSGQGPSNPAPGPGPGGGSDPSQPSVPDPVAVLPPGPAADALAELEKKLESVPKAPDLEALLPKLPGAGSLPGLGSNGR